MQKILIENRNGSVEHYFHFLLGFCVPLVDYFLAHPGEADDCWAIRECGPMTPILQELPLPLKIFPKAKLIPEPAGPPPVQLFGLDAPRYFSQPVFKRFKNYILDLARMRPRLTKSSRLLLVEREPADPFYASPGAERKTSGASRRRIRNHGEIASSLAVRYPDLQNIRLAGLPLCEQAALFHDADLVIAQHGAALGNLIFMREGAGVIEIGTKSREFGLFHRLACTMKLNHRFLEVESRFPMLEPAKLWALVDAFDRSAAPPGKR